MKSMTGYGLFRGQTAEASIEISLKTVNGRFLETRFHLPRAYYAYEVELKKKLNEFIKRGTVDIYVSRKPKENALNNKIVVNTRLAQEYVRAFRKLAKDIKVKDDLKFDHILRQQDVVALEETQQVSSQEVQGLKKIFEAALKKLDHERSREGMALKKDISKNLKDLQKITGKISKLRDEANKNLQQKYEQKLKARLSKDVANIDPQRIAQEIIIQIEKADINEEIIRLTEHVKNFERLIETAPVEGKKLDFYTQELLREINTIGSKSQVAEITNAVVEAKTMIERLREQVQNIE